MTSVDDHQKPRRAPVRGDGNRHWYDFDQAQPFVDPVSGAAPHYIEASIAVYLRLADNGKAWIVDGASVDGGELDESSDIHSSNCPCSDEDACAEAVESASKAVPLPNGQELIAMLIAACDVVEGDHQ